MRDPRLAVDALGLRFPNPVGLAAGLDKDGRAPAAFAALGLGAVEIGTVTPRAQPGNPRPRIFRLPADGALINRMGFPNRGAPRVPADTSPCGSRAAAAPPLPGGAVLGFNLGKNAATPLHGAPADYVAVLDALYDLAAYAVVNVSSPNTQGLRDLQERRALEALLRAVVATPRLPRPPPADGASPCWSRSPPTWTGPGWGPSSRRSTPPAWRGSWPPTPPSPGRA